jgi:hypothetical protein
MACIPWSTRVLTGDQTYELDISTQAANDQRNGDVQVEGLETLTGLSDLWLNDNPVRDLDHLPDALQSCKDSLQVVYLENSPAAKSTTSYLLIMKQMLPKLEYLDSTPIGR